MSKWIGPVPKNCQLCNCPITDTFVDGRHNLPHRGGIWAYMCALCHNKHGFGFGQGNAQIYTKQADGSFKKVEG
jgi:hypothetical protein